MKTRNKTILKALAFRVMAFASFSLTIYEPRLAAQGYQGQRIVQRHPGMEKILATLKQESLDESLDLMTGKDDQQYFFPGYQTSDRISPAIDLETMLSTRRSIKLMQGIKSLSKRDAEAKCRRLFSEAFQKHTNACHTVLKHAADTNSPPNTQSMLGTKMGLSAAMFITAEIGRLDLLSDQFAQLDHWRDEIEPLAFVPHTRGPNHLPSLNSLYIAPDYRLQVNVLRLAALRSGNATMLKQVDAECAAAKMTVKEFPIVAWDAETTAFEIHTDSPLDTSKGVTMYTFYGWSDDYRNVGDIKAGREKQKDFVLKLQAIVFRKEVVR